MIEKENIKEKEIEVGLYEGGKAKHEDCVRVHPLGYFLKNDPRIVDDILFPTGYFIINDERYTKYFKYDTIYKNINDKGELIDPGVSIYRKTHYGVSVIMVDGKYAINTIMDNPIFKSYYVEDLYTGNFQSINKPLRPFIKLNKHRGVKFNMYYNEFIRNELENKPTTYVKMLGKQYTWGVEIETINGLLPMHLTRNMYFSSVHDGSLRHKDDNEVYGLEYVTNVLVGDLGLKQLKMLTNEISKRCSINYQCGNHFHLGGINFTKENIVFMYYLYQKIQNEMFTLLPLARRNNIYCKKLPKLSIDIKKLDVTSKDYNFFINVYFHEILQFANKRIVDLTKYNKKTQHHQGFKCGYDHNAARYCWVNFIPALFNTRENGQYTIEFRMASGGSSYRKNKNWLLLCIALVDVIENHKTELLKNIRTINLEQIVSISYGDKATEILEFIKERKEMFNTDSESKSKELEERDYLDNEIDDNLSLKNL